MTSNGTDEYIPFNHDYTLAFKLTVGLVCLLSIAGSLLVIFTYVLFKNLRTVARQLLVNLSVADILANSSHIFGMAANLSRNATSAKKSDVHFDVIAACSSQGGLALFGTVACFLWTIALAFHLFALLVIKRSKVRRGLVAVFYVICWGLPLTLVIAYASGGFLGYEEVAHVGWCYVRSRFSQRWIAVVGYDAWMCLVLLTLFILFAVIELYLRTKLSGPRNNTFENLKSAARATELKLAAVWVSFLLIRIWSFVLHIWSWSSPNKVISPPTSVIIMVYFAGIGNSSQGLVNAFLFCLFTRTARQRLWAATKNCCRWTTEERRPMIMLSSTTVSGDEDLSFYRSEETERLLNVPAPAPLT